MKRILCALLCLLLAFPCAVAEEDTAYVDIAALMARQVSGNSAFRTLLTAEFSGNKPALLSAELWDTLRALAADTGIETAYVFSRAGETLGNSQATLYVKRGGETLSTLHLSGLGEQWILWGDALGEEALRLPRDTSLLLKNRYLTLAAWAGALLRGLGQTDYEARTEQPGGWPGIFRLLTRALTEDAAWQQRLTDRLERYTEQISNWLRANTTLRLARGGDGTVGTSSEIRLDAAALKEEALALLDLFYKDRALQSLLREQMTEAEAQAYLEPGMRRLFEQVLTQMTLPEDLTLTRGFAAEDGAGDMTLRMPLANGATLVWESGSAGNAFGLDREGLSLRLGISGAEGSWQGRFSILRGDTRWAGNYQLFLSLEPTYEDEDAGGRQRRQNGTATLLIMPEEGQDLPAQTLTAAITAWAGLRNDEPAHFNVDLEWREQESGAWANVSLKTRTGAALRQIAAPEEAIDGTALDQTERKTVIQRIFDHFAGLLLPAAD